MKVGVLALQGDFAEHKAVLARLGAIPIEVRLPEHLGGLDGLVIPGGESTTLTRLMSEYGLLEPIRRLAGDGVPIWGTCAGMIVLARQPSNLARPGLGIMDIVIARNAFGRQVDSFEAMLTIPALGSEPFPAVFIRAPVIRQVGPEVEVLARLPSRETAGVSGANHDGTAIVAVRQGRMLATAFHPELTDDPRLHRYFLTLLDPARRPSPLKAASPAAQATWGNRPAPTP